MPRPSQHATGPKPYDARQSQVDAHNVVPVWTTSDHLETMARTIRPKIHARPSFLCEFPLLAPNPEGTKLAKPTDWGEAERSLDLDRSVKGERHRLASAGWRLRPRPATLYPPRRAHP